jgi:hypothetical protein
VLSGPAGAGKSTAVQSIAKGCAIQVVEWINPIDEGKLTSQQEGTPSLECVNIELESLSHKFTVFLQSSQRYASLDSNSKQLILIQDIPNTIGSSSFVSQARHVFQTTLKEFLMSSRVRFSCYPCRYRIGSRLGRGYSLFIREGFTVKGLLGDDILLHPATSISCTIPFKCAN